MYILVDGNLCFNSLLFAGVEHSLMEPSTGVNQLGSLDQSLFTKKCKVYSKLILALSNKFLSTLPGVYESQFFKATGGVNERTKRLH